MATDLKLRDTQNASPNVDLTVIGVDRVYDMVDVFGAAVVEHLVDLTSGGTEILWTAGSGGQTLAWISGRVPAGGFTLTSTFLSAWFKETNMNANAGGRFRVFRYRPGSPATLTELGGGPFNDGVEFGTAYAEMTWTGNVTDLAFQEDDRVVVKIYATNVGTMGAFMAGLEFNAADAATGDAFFQIAETVTFKTEPVTQEITAAGAITTAEAFGSPALDQTADPSAIGSAEAFGSPTVELVGPVQEITGAGNIASAEAVGATALDETVNPSGIAGAEAFGTAALDATVNPTGIGSAEALGTSALALTVDPAGIASGAAVGNPALDQAVSPGAIGSAETLGTATLDQTIDAGGIPTGEGAGSPALDQSLDLVALGSVESFGSPQVSIAGGPQEITGAGAIGSGELVGVLVVDLTLNPSGIPSAAVFGTLGLDLILDLLGIATAAALGNPTVDAVVLIVFVTGSIAPAVPIRGGGIAAAVGLPGGAVGGPAALVGGGIDPAWPL